MNTIYTIGHGRHSATHVRERLDRHGVDLLVDVRSYPNSTRNPQARRSAFERVLGERYLWLGAQLGGMHAIPPIWWEGGIAKLLELAETRTLAVLCAESRPEDCHRGIQITPDLYAATGDRPLQIIHILEDGSLRPDDSTQRRLL